jgi:hypothetical protein
MEQKPVPLVDLTLMERVPPVNLTLVDRVLQVD